MQNLDSFMTDEEYINMATFGEIKTFFYSDIESMGKDPNGSNRLIYMKNGKILEVGKDLDFQKVLIGKAKFDFHKETITNGIKDLNREKKFYNNVEKKVENHIKNIISYNEILNKEILSTSNKTLISMEKEYQEHLSEIKEKLKGLESLSEHNINSKMTKLEEIIEAFSPLLK